MFELHTKLAADTVQVTSLALCRVLLMNDCRWPWLILVPEQSGLTEIHQLNKGDRQTLIEEIAVASQVLEEIDRPDKINVGALGNMVPQLHLHVIARWTSDPAWPGPVWGHGTPLPYDSENIAVRLARLRQLF
jgi:diadenosine tetraphosphate (Ap4A) HIT family hydrolase